MEYKSELIDFEKEDMESKKRMLGSDKVNIEEIKERHSKIGGTPWKASEYSTDYYLQGYSVKTWNDGDIANCIEEKGEVDFIANAPTDIAYLLSIIEQQNEILKSLAYTVLADFTHMSEYHINSTIVELANKAEKLCNMDIKSRATNEVVSEHWNLEE